MLTSPVKEVNEMSNPNEGTMYQRGPNGETPDGQSIDGESSAYGTIGNDEHVTMYGKDWYRSWDNPGTERDHTTDHNIGEKTNNY